MADDKKKDKGDKGAEKHHGKGDKHADAPAKAKPQLSAADEKKRAERAEAKSKGGKGGKSAKAETVEEAGERAPARLRLAYEKDVVPSLMKEFGYTNPMQVPRLRKITVNMGLGEAISNPKVMDSAVEELAAIAGQKPVVTKAKKSIATFKLRQGQKIGCMVTLRGDKMFEFMDRLIALALPRVRDFKGVSPKSFDGRGNYSLGIREQIIFPEINYDEIDKIKGMNVSFVTSARTDDEGRALLKAFGMPFRS